jgi:hypothetical protein
MQLVKTQLPYKLVALKVLSLQDRSTNIAGSKAKRKVVCLLLF